jgi:hypothetical protein
MPTKTTPDGRTYEVEGKKFTWHPLDDNDEPGNLPDITIPLRVKLKVARHLPAGDTLDVDSMFAMLESLIPHQADALDEMEIVSDFTPMFQAWQTEYNALSGASLGEASGSAPSSQSTAQPSTTTGAPAST